MDPRKSQSGKKPEERAARSATEAEEAAREAEPGALTDEEKARLAAEASRGEDA